MKLWVDDVRPAPIVWCQPGGYHWAKSVNHAILMIEEQERFWPDNKFEVIDIDHDAGDYQYDGGDYIKLLDWLEETGRNYPIRIHSMNPVGVENMRRIIQKNGWREIR